MRTLAFDKRRPAAPDPMVLEVRQAREEWLSAVNLFQSAADPQLVEYAVYQMEASRRRYMYLLRLAGEKA